MDQVKSAYPADNGIDPKAAHQFFPRMRTHLDNKPTVPYFFFHSMYNEQESKDANLRTFGFRRNPWPQPGWKSVRVGRRSLSIGPYDTVLRCNTSPGVDVPDSAQVPGK